MEDQPRLLELFAGAQGAAVGYARAGFAVTAVDIEEHARHPEVAEFVTADAMEVLADRAYCQSFDVVAAGPPCQRYSAMTRAANREAHPDLVGPVRAALEGLGVPWVLENVPRSPLAGELMLCGSMFGLRALCRGGVSRQLRRHRLFGSSAFLYPPGLCRHRGSPVGVYGSSGNKLDGSQRGYQGSWEERQTAMGIDWMSMEDLTESIPPVYTKWIGEQMMDDLNRTND